LDGDETSIAEVTSDATFDSALQDVKISAANKIAQFRLCICFSVGDESYFVARARLAQASTHLLPMK
jgi:hypothetical protein